MAARVSQWPNGRGTLRGDGGTGRSRFGGGVGAGAAPERWKAARAGRITALYRGATDAGSDLFLTNSFGANAARLKLHGAEKDTHRLARLSAEIGREVADTAGRTVIVAGSVGPTGEIMEPVGELTHALAVEIFHEAADGLKAGGADIGWLETISAPEEFAAAAEGFDRAGLDWVGTMSFDTAGRAMMGVTSTALAGQVDAMATPPLAFGANCGTGASDLVRTILGFAATGTQRPIIAKANAGIPQYVDGEIHYDGTPELMADYAELVRNAGARIIGGCCGTMPVHLRHMREALDSRPLGAAPTLDEVTAKLGAFSSESDGTGGDCCGSAPKRSRRGRRRAA